MVGYGAACVMAAAAVWPACGETDVLQSLTQDQRLKVVVAALQQREAKLSNLRCQLTERSRNISGDGHTLREFADTWIEMRQAGPRQWLNIRRMNEDGAVVLETVKNYDQRTATAKSYVNRFIPGRAVRGMITNRQSNSFVMHRFSEILGQRIVYATPDDAPPLSEWLVRARKDGCDVSIDSVANGDMPRRVMVRAVNRQADWTWQFTLDAAKGYMLTEAAFGWSSAAPTTNSISQVVEMRTVDGLVVPTRASLESWNATAEARTHWDYDVHDIRVGQTKPEDTEVAFPVGAEVVNMVTGLGYRVLPQGAVEPLPVYDPDTGKRVSSQIASPSEAVDEALQMKKPQAMETPLSTPVDAPDSPASPPLPPQKSGLFPPWAYALGLAVGVAALLVGIWRVRCRSREAVRSSHLTP
jgi:hypothetical protein